MKYPSMITIGDNLRLNRKYIIGHFFGVDIPAHTKKIGWFKKEKAKTSYELIIKLKPKYFPSGVHIITGLSREKAIEINEKLALQMQAK